MRRTLRALAAPFLTALAVAAPAGAVPAAYVEAVDGDLPMSTYPLPVVTLDVGVNTVTGTYSFALAGAFDYDSFAFVVPDGQSVTGGAVVVSDLVGDPSRTDWILERGELPGYFGHESVKHVQAASPGADTIPALPAGNYSLRHVNISGDGTAAYTFTFTVVPEPAGLALLALAAPALLRRRRER